MAKLFSQIETEHTDEKRK